MVWLLVPMFIFLASCAGTYNHRSYVISESVQEEPSSYQEGETRHYTNRRK